MAPPLARRGPTAGGSAGPIAALVVLGGVGAVWVGGTVGAWTRGAPGPGNPLAYVILLARQEVVWPGVVATVVTAVLLVTLAAAVTGGLLRAGSRVSDREVRGKARYLAQTRDLDGLTQRTALARARDFRPSLPRQGKVPMAATGVLLGRLQPARAWVIASWEDVLLAIMAPRARKTTGLAVPAIVNAPGAVVATSMKPDLVDLTAGVRAGVGRVWRFDPQAITAGGRQLWWNPLAHVQSIDAARLLAAHFIQEVSAGGSDADFWSNASLNVLANLLLAAGVSHGTLRDVWRWINTPAAPEPARRLHAGGHPSSAAGLRGTGSGAPETREGIYENVRTACACLADESILAWVTPPPPPPNDDGTAGQEGSGTADPAAEAAAAATGDASVIETAAEMTRPPDELDTAADDTDSDRQDADRQDADRQDADDRPTADDGQRVKEGGVREFTASGFLASRDTLYLLSQDDAGAAQPLVAALVDEIARTATALANRRPNRRLDPPLLLVLDEAANICKIRRLPQLYSHLGSRSVVPITILQSYDQAELVWGEKGARALWSAATIKLFGAGLDSPTLTTTISTLVGDHDVQTTSVGTGGAGRNGAGGGRSQTTGVTRERILTPGDVRNLPKGWAVLLATGHRPAMIQLQPWYEGDHRHAITASQQAASAASAAEPNQADPRPAAPVIDWDTVDWNGADG